jgi:hypothetical protein
MGPLLHQFAGALGGPHSAAHAARRSRSQQRNQIVIGAAADRRIEIDHLDLREGREPFQHNQRGVTFERLLAALHKLHHFAVHEVDTRQDHTRIASVVGQDCILRPIFNRPRLMRASPARRTRPDSFSNRSRCKCRNEK